MEEAPVFVITDIDESAKTVTISSDYGRVLEIPWWKFQLRRDLKDILDRYPNSLPDVFTEYVINNQRFEGEKIINLSTERMEQYADIRWEYTLARSKGQDLKQIAQKIVNCEYMRIKLYSMHGEPKCDFERTLLLDTLTFPPPLEKAPKIVQNRWEKRERIEEWTKEESKKLKVAKEELEKEEKKKADGEEKKKGGEGTAENNNNV